MQKLNGQVVDRSKCAAPNCPNSPQFVIRDKKVKDRVTLQPKLFVLCDFHKRLSDAMRPNTFDIVERISYIWNKKPNE